MSSLMKQSMQEKRHIKKKRKKKVKKKRISFFVEYSFCPHFFFRDGFY